MGTYWALGSITTHAMTCGLRHGIFMPRKPSSFRQTDVLRAIKAAKAAGIPISRVKIEPSGAIIIDCEAAPGPADSTGTAEPNEWDRGPKTAA
jgi:hypothetical protein